jgi:hypothetical protein
MSRSQSHISPILRRPLGRASRLVLQKIGRTMSSIVTPEGYRLHCENGAKLLLPASNEAFLNPVQEFNRDLSVASIRVWSEQFNEIKEKRWDDKRKRKGQGATQQPEPKRKKGMFYYIQTSPHAHVHSLVNICF